MNINYINLVLVIFIVFLLSQFYKDYSRRTKMASPTPKEQLHLTEEHRDRLIKQMTEEFRRIVVENEMDRNIELTFLLKQDGAEDLVIQHYIGPKDSGQVPYFVPGVLYVTHNESTVFVDISDKGKEYIFTVHPDGSVTQVTQVDRESQA